MWPPPPNNFAISDTSSPPSLDLKLKVEDAVYACKSALRGGYVKGGGLCLKEIAETLEVVRGSTVRARNIGRDIFAGLKNLVGGEIGEYTKLLADSREQAFHRMIKDAAERGGPAMACPFLFQVLVRGASFCRSALWVERLNKR